MRGSHYDRAWQLHELDRYQEALIEAEKALAEDPNDPDTHILRCQCLGSLGKAKEARKAVQQAIAADPDHARSYATSAWLYLHTARPKEALADALKAIQVDPDDAHSHYFAAIAFSTLGNHAKAREAIDYAIYLQPLASTYFAAKANIYNLSRDKKTALDAAEEALRLDPENAEAFATRARLLRTTRHHRDAVGAAKESLRLDPTEARHRDDYLHAKRSRFFLYRWLLVYSEWRDALPSNLSYLPWVGFLAIRALGRGLPNEGSLVFLKYFLIGLYVTFMAIWVFGDVLLDSLMSLDSQDKYAIPFEERRGLLSVSTNLLVGLIFLPICFLNEKAFGPTLMELLAGFLIGSLLYKIQSLSWRGNLMFAWSLSMHALALVIAITSGRV